MSCFQVEQITICRITSFVRKTITDGRGRCSSYYSDAWADMAADRPDEFGTALIALNYESLSNRYSDFKPPAHWTHQHSSVGTSKYQGVAAINCLLYQCSEANTDDPDGLYQWLEKLRDRVCRDYFEGMPAFEAVRQQCWC